jgi:hypothetical protein
MLYFGGVALCGFIINQRFGGTSRFRLQGRRNNASEESVRRLLRYLLTLLLARVISSTLNMEATRSFETSVYNNTPKAPHARGRHYSTHVEFFETHFDASGLR